MSEKKWVFYMCIEVPMTRILSTCDPSSYQYYMTGIATVPTIEEAARVAISEVKRGDKIVFVRVTDTDEMESIEIEGI